MIALLALLGTAWAAAPEISVGVGAFPFPLAMDARVYVPVSEKVDAGFTAAIGPQFFPVPIPLSTGDSRMTALWVSGRAGAYLRRRWWLSDAFLFVPSVEGVLRTQVHHVSVDALDRSRTSAGIWPELRVNARLEWRLGVTAGSEALEPLALEARVDTTVNGPYAAYDQMIVTLGVRWTFLEE